MILPALDEAATLAEMIDRIPRQIPGIREVRVLVVDDGSTDATAAEAERAGALVVRHARNMGLGVAIQTGLAEAVRLGADYVVNVDADGQFAPETIPEVLRPVIEGRADMATASRFVDPSLVPDMPALKRWGNRGMSWLVSRLSGQRYYDVSCGFRAYSREAILRLVLLGRFTYTQEMFLALSFRGMRIAEVPVAVKGRREHGVSRIAASLVRYGFRTLRIIFGFVRDYRPGMFFGAMAVACLLPAFGLAGFFVLHRIVAGTFSPHIWAGFLSAFLLALTLVLFIFGQLAAMIGRVRRIQEEQLYMIRKALGADQPDSRP